MTHLDDYAKRFTRASLQREEGVLEIALHGAQGGELVWDEAAHRELPELFHAVGSDGDNRVVILTGSGENFCAEGDNAAFPSPLTSQTWDKIFTEGRRLIGNLLDIEVPMIAAVNGPATWHAELALLCDIVLAADDTVLQDAPHFPYAVPGDGVHNVWPTLLGANRGRYFLLTKQEIGAQEAKELGIVHEVMARSALLPRARELARSMLTSDPLTLKYTRLALTRKLRRAVLEDLDYGLALEGLAATQA